MTSIILRIYEFLGRHKTTAWTLFVVFTALLAYSLTRIDYNEDITDFLPLDRETRSAIDAYRNAAGADRIYALVSCRDGVNPEMLTDGIERLSQRILDKDSTGMVKTITKEIDFERIDNISQLIYGNIPLFMTRDDYTRIDSLMAIPGYIDRKIATVKENLLAPAAELTAGNIANDPLGLFSPIISDLLQNESSLRFETFDGYILTPDSLNAIAIIESVYGGQESDRNSRLVKMLEDAASETEAETSLLDIRYLGGAAIAVGNANRIRHDTMLAVTIAGLLIIGLLAYAFRSLRNITLIIVSVAWGWLFAIGLIAVFEPTISLIVIGMTSVILGIAVNYPLHLIDHLKDSIHPEQSLKEVISPLLVGNVTTVGAFLCLIPLKSPALHDLGLFSSLLLAGTIFFVLIFLPHAVKIRPKDSASSPTATLLDRIAAVHFERKRWPAIFIAVTTVILGYFSFDTEFDTQLSNINYMSPQQKADMSAFQKLLYSDNGSESLYIVSSSDDWETALQRNEIAGAVVDSLSRLGMIDRSAAVCRFMPSLKEQSARLARWNDFVSAHESLYDSINVVASHYGFSPAAFDGFSEILTKDYSTTPLYSEPLITDMLLAGNISGDTLSGELKHIIMPVNVAPENADSVRSAINCCSRGSICFNLSSISEKVSRSLTDNFNYIGVVCALIVFVFLWISLGNIELAIVSFTPMAISWIWILGFMGLLDMKFNLVNIILATFIFGQGDDYTIFITEGLCYEYAYRRRLLSAYKKSIIISALIMFIGIGCLIFAKHPALRSLGEVTVVGMFSVVIMAYILPPLLFGFLTHKNGKLRKQPLSLSLLYRRIFQRKMNRNERIAYAVLDRYRYKGADVFRHARRRLREIRMGNVNIPQCPVGKEIIINDTHQGELALFIALLYPEKEITVHIADPDTRLLLEGCARDFVSNLTVIFSLPSQ